MDDFVSTAALGRLSDYPPHGTRYRSSGLVGDFWISIPVVAALAVVAGLATALLVEMMALHGGPYGYMPVGRNARAKLLLVILLTAWWVVSTALLPLASGWIAGRVARKARTRSNLALVALSINGALGTMLGCFIGLSAMLLAVAAAPTSPGVGEIVRMLPTAASQFASTASTAWSTWNGWDLAALASAGTGCGIGVLLGRGVGRRAMYDEVGGGWYGRATPIGGRYVDPKPDAPLDADDVATLEPLPEGARLPVGRTWIELEVHPAAVEAPSSELISALRCREEVDADETTKKTKKARKDRNKRNKALRRQGLPEEPEAAVDPVVTLARKNAMPPTYIDREIFDGWR
jgi:hypothetical protein